MSQEEDVVDKPMLPNDISTNHSILHKNKQFVYRSCRSKILRPQNDSYQKFFATQKYALSY